MKSTIIEKCINFVSEIYPKISPLWWARKPLDNIKDGTWVRQAATDIWVIFKLVLSGVSLIFGELWVWIAVYVAIESVLAHLAHLLSDKYNSAGAGKTTSANRTLTIAIINLTSISFCFGTMYQSSENIPVLDSLCLSAGVLSTSGTCLPNSPTDFSKGLMVAQTGVSVFFLIVILQTIVGMIPRRDETSGREQ